MGAEFGKLGPGIRNSFDIGFVFSKLVVFPIGPTLEYYKAVTKVKAGGH